MCESFACKEREYGNYYTILANLSLKFFQNKKFLKTDARHILYNTHTYKLPLEDPQVPRYVLGILNLLSLTQPH